MMRSFLIFLIVGLCITAFASAQTPFAITPGSAANGLLWPVMPVSTVAPSDSVPPLLVSPASLPRMAPDLALETFENRVSLQTAQLASYSASTLIRAELPDTSQSGEFELERHYVAPRTLQFKAIHFSGDSFVKTNVIARLLQSEVDHLQKDDLSMTALSPANYKFSYKGTGDVDGRSVHVFQVKPRKKRAGLFKGRIYLDAYSGSLVRAEGSVVKSPSFFIKKVEFVQSYADVNGFTLPTHVHSEARARIVGRAIVDIYQSDYQPVASPVQASQRIPTL
jgi:hypothetical protein